MKSGKIATAIIALSVMTACTSKNNDTANDNDNSAAQTVTANIDVRGQWDIENIVFSDSDYVRPSEQAADSRQYIAFDDSTYFIQTNCNTFSGPYTVNGDSITLGDGAMTEMACDNMATEDAIRRILPNIVTVDLENDSVARLNSINSSEYILLRKASEQE